MLSLQNINLYFGSNHLLQNISFTISKGEKIALIGKNGAGKTTLFKIITKELPPEDGHVQMPSGYKIGYLSQHFDFDENRTISDICNDVFKEYFDTEKEIMDLSGKLENNLSEDEMTSVLEKLDTLSIKQQAMIVSNPHAEIARILKGLGFTEDQFEHKVSSLSGGWKMRVQIAKLLLMQPDLLLLDEPDNHLDIEALIWFEKYINSYSGAVLFISHDVEFMRNTANRILELSNRSISDYKMNYNRYVDEKSVRREKEEQAFVNQQKVIKQKERTINRFMAKATKTKMAQSMQKQLDKLDRVEMESDDVTQIDIQFPETQPSGKRVLTIRKLNKSFGSKHVIRDLDMEIDRGQKIAFVGQNGQGKSTLVKLIVDALSADSGEIEKGHNVIVSYFAQNQSEIFYEKYDALQTLEMQADTEFVPKARKTLGAFAFSGDDVYKKVSVLSGGEKARLAMACMVSRQSNFLLLDEPTNHLDIHSKAILKTAVANYPGTLIIVSHDREILRGIIDVTYEFRDGKIHQHLGDLDYVLSKRDAENVRDYANSSAGEKQTTKTSKSKAKSELSYEEQKQMNRKLSRVEKQIDKLEKEIKDIHSKLMDPDYYNSPEGVSSMKKLTKLESDLETSHQEWDELVSSMDQ